MWRRIALGVSLVLVAAAVSAQALQARSDGSVAAQQTTATLQWSQDGQPVGDPVVAPENADDFVAKWPTRKHGGAKLQWSLDGQPVGSPVAAPRQATEIELRWNPASGEFTDAWWMRDCVRFKTIAVPAGADDVHFKLTKRRSVFIRAIWRANREPIPPDVSVPAGVNDFELVLAPAGSADVVDSPSSAPSAC